MVTVNGKKKEWSGKTVEEMLQSSGYQMERVAVELNEEILPRTQYAETILKTGDCVEVIEFVGGG